MAERELFQSLFEVMDAPLFYTNPCFCPHPARSAMELDQSPGVAGAQGFTWKKRDHPSENHLTYTHTFAQSGLQHIPSEKEKKAMESTTVPQFPSFPLFPSREP